ncbi:MAG: formylglycine-generating enzyme family protein [Pseudomonadota bacterium]
MNVLLRSTLLALAISLLATAISATSAPEFVRLEGGAFQMGSAEHYREEGPVRSVSVGAFEISRTEVTNDQFAAFVDATGYVTTAELGLSAEDYPDMPEDLLAPGSMVFAQPADPANLANAMAWWRYVAGASWRHPQGPGSSIEGLGAHPVVQVSPEDAEAYANWVGGRLPSEAEWEYAALGGADETVRWDEPFDPVSGWKANTWQGRFPDTDMEHDGYHGTAPAASFEANGYGLHDLLGNVWEHVGDWWAPGHLPEASDDPKGPSEAFSAQFSHPSVGAQRVVKGGSWLCAPSYCLRYRPSARQPSERGLGSNHIGFRVARDVDF